MICWKSALVGASFGILAATAVITAKAEAYSDLNRINPVEVEKVVARIRPTLRATYPQIKDTQFPAYALPLRRSAAESRGDAGGVIVIDADRPTECEPFDIAHEYTHLALAKFVGMTPKQSEGIARLMERLSTDDYQPNCESELP